jgi:hypothetical protein
MRGQLHQLELVYPPVSNQEGEWLKDHSGVQEALNLSNLYFIAQRSEAFYEFPETVKDDIKVSGLISFSIWCGETIDTAPCRESSAQCSRDDGSERVSRLDHKRTYSFCTIQQQL